MSNTTDVDANAGAGGARGDQMGANGAGQGQQQAQPLFNLDALPDDLRGHAAARGYEKLTDPVELLKANFHYDQMMGSNPIAGPKDGDLSGFFGANAEMFGVPDSLDDYKIVADDAPADVDRTFTAALAEYAHGKKYPPAMVADLVGKTIEYFQDETEATNKAASESVATEKQALRTEWGAAYDEKMAATQRGAQFLGIDRDTQAAFTQMLGYAGVAKMLARVGEQVGEDQIVMGAGGGATALTPNEAKAELARLNKEHGDALQDKGHPDYPEKSKRYKQLNDIIHGAATGTAR